MNPLEKVLEKIQQKLAQHDNAIRKLQRDKFVDENVHVLTASYSGASAYNNILIVAGYAAFFAMWGFLRDDIPKTASHWALLLMMVSVTVFVLWEVAKMIWNAEHQKRQMKALAHSQNPRSQFELAKERERSQLDIFVRVWKWQIIVTVGTGVAAIAVVVWNLLVLVF